MPDSFCVDFGALKAQLSVWAVLDALHWTCRRTEAGWKRGGCPVHQRNREHGDCFAATPTGWKCHSCGAHGDVIALWRAVYGQTARDAATELCHRFDLRLPRLARRPRKRRTRNREEAR